MTDPEFDRLMAVLISAVGRAMPREQVDVWRELLIDLEFDAAKRGVIAVLRDYKYAGFPPIGLIRQAAGAASGIIDADTSAQLAWDKVLKSIRLIGAYKSVEWDDPAIPAAIEYAAGSWPQLCDTQTDELHTWTKKLFIEGYRAHRTANTLGATDSKGIIAADSGRIGGDVPEPVRLGDDQKRVYGFGHAEHPKALPEPLKPVLALPAPEDAEPAEDVEVRRERMKRELAERYPELKPV